MLVALVVAETVALALLGLLVAGLLRSHAEILGTLHRLGAGLDPDAVEASRGRRAGAAGGSGAAGSTPAHDVTGVDLTGDDAVVGVIGARHDTVLAFLSSGCLTCQPFWTALREGASAPAGSRVVVVVRDAQEESPSRLAELAGPNLSVVMSTEAWDDYAVPGSPHFAYVDGTTGRVVGEGVAQSWAQVLDLLGRAATDARHPTATRRAWLPDPTSSQAQADEVAGSARARDTASRDTSGRDNAGRIDAELAAAGIGEQHPSLFPGQRP